MSVRGMSAKCVVIVVNSFLSSAQVEVVTTDHEKLTTSDVLDIV